MHRNFYVLISCIIVLVFFNCNNRLSPSYPLKEHALVPQKAKAIAQEMEASTTVELADGFEISLWASDSLINDPVAISMDPLGGIYYTNGSRLENSEFDIRGHRDWMTASISWETVEDRRAFLRKTLDPSNSEESKKRVEDVNGDGSHDWLDLTVEKEAIWRLEDTDGDGYADRTQMYIEDFHEEITDLANGVEYHDGVIYMAVGPDLWRLEDLDGDGRADTKESLSHGYAVHIGFGAHGMSGVIMGPDGRLYWGIGDIGMNVTDKTGKQWKYPNQGVIVRCEPDGSNFEVFAAGLRNTHEFVFDKYGNLISEDNDGDHPGERERLVYVTDGSDAGWRANWQYGKYTDPDNNSYKVWMDEKMHIPRWDGQAAYITPTLANYVNGPTGMVYNPGTALGEKWEDHFFIAEFRGTPANSPIHAFTLKSKGATFALDTTYEIIKGVLPTGLDFGPEGALYFGDWIDGWGVKNKGKLWKLDVADKHPLRQTTMQYIQSDFSQLSSDELKDLLAFPDMRVRQKAQFQIVKMPAAKEILASVLNHKEDQLARVHALWGLGQMARRNPVYGSALAEFLSDDDPEIRAQAAKLIGDTKYTDANDQLIALLNEGPRIQFFAAQALGRLGEEAAIQPLIDLLIRNNDEDAWLRHAASLALARIGEADPLLALSEHQSKAAKTGAILALRRLKHSGIAEFLTDNNEFIVTESARAINDDYSIPDALPALAELLNTTAFENEALIRRSINANLRVGLEKNLMNLLDYARMVNNPIVLRVEAIEAASTWSNPSVLDRVDGRYRGEVHRDIEPVRQAFDKVFDELFGTEPSISQALLNAAIRLEMNGLEEVVLQEIRQNKAAGLASRGLDYLQIINSNQLDLGIDLAINSSDEKVRTHALTILPEVEISPDKAFELYKRIYKLGGTSEQQASIKGMSNLGLEKSTTFLKDLLSQMHDGKLDKALHLEVLEAANSTDTLGTAEAEMTSNEANPLSAYLACLEGGDPIKGREIFFRNEAAQCVRCHSIWEWGGDAGPNLMHLGERMDASSILESLIEPSAKLAAGYGVVALTLTDGSKANGFLFEENDDEIKIKTSEGEVLEINKSSIQERIDVPSSMPSVTNILDKYQIRDLVAFLRNLKADES